MLTRLFRVAEVEQLWHQTCNRGVASSIPSHTTMFWQLVHNLVPLTPVQKARERGASVYRNNTGCSLCSLPLTVTIHHIQGGPKK